MYNKLLFSAFCVLSCGTVAFGANQFQSESTLVKENNTNSSIVVWE